MPLRRRAPPRPATAPELTPAESHGSLGGPGAGAERRRRAGLYAAAGAWVVLLVVLLLLVLRNRRQVRLDWVVGSTHASLVWLLVVSAIVGWLLGLVTVAVVRRRARARRNR